MAKYLRYMGEFLSRSGVTWRAEILQEADEPFTTIGSLTFEADEPLLIEWGEKSKEEVIQSSTATLKIESPGDRTYEDLYSIDVERVRLDVYRNGTIYWSGMLDPEFYEEPYERARFYPVTLTFSDFGILNRKKYSLAGMLTLSSLVSHCLAATGINYGAFSEEYISTSFEVGGEKMSLSDLKVRSDNFYDEDGEALTLEEVLTGVLQPLALRIIQRAGTIYVYDLNGLYHNAENNAVVWDGDSSTMGVDAVYNNAKITWSTYAQSGNLAPKECWTLPVDKNKININNLTGASHGDATYYSYHYSTDLWDWIDATDSGFTLWLSRTGQNAELINDAIQFFKIVPQYDGSEKEGIAIFFNAVRGYKVGSGSNWESRLEWRGSTTVQALAGTTAAVNSSLFKSAEVWMPPVDNSSNLLVRIAIDLLLDPRFNPHESAVDWGKYIEQKDFQNQWKARGNYVYIPVTIKFQPDGSDTVYCWDNRNIVKQDIGTPIRTLNATLGTWKIYAETDGIPDVWGYLCYYDASDREENSGVANGWAKNRPAINPHKKDIISILENCDAGQYIPYPTYGGGKLWVEILSDGWMISDAGANLSATEIVNPYNLWGETNGMRGPKMSWVLMQLPEIEIVNNVQFEQAINTDDVEYSAEINASAKEAIELDTICGSHKNGVPTARGAYFNADTGKQVKQLSRAGRITQVENLLIGTLYSQFAQRHTKLSGEMQVLRQGVCTYTEQNQEGKLFVMAQDLQNVIADTSEATIIELSPDEYVEINE